MSIKTTGISSKIKLISSEPLDINYTKLIGFVLILTCLTYLSCDSVDPNNSDLLFYYSLSGVVLDHVDDGSPYEKEGAPIVLDGDTSISNSEGEYSFQNVLIGQHTISFSSQGYEYFENKITIHSDTNFDIHIYGLKEDYFPIEVNAQKNYQYSSGGGGVFWYYSSGEAIWDIHSSAQQGDDVIYNVRETLTYVTITQFGDTLPPVTEITNFKFIEDNSHIITIQYSDWDGMSFYRYLDPRRGEIIMFGEIPGHSIYLKKGVGIWKLHFEEWQHLSGKTYQLIE